MSYDREIEERKTDLLEGLIENIKWQNAMMATMSYEIAQLQYVIMCAEGDVPDTPDHDSMMDQAAMFRDMWEHEYHPSVRRR